MLFSMLARLRALFFFLFFLPRFVHSREEVIFTSSVTYCSPPETLLIERFYVIYFASNQSVSFNISAASVQSHVNVTANLFLNVYGLKPINYTIDLCQILDGALCPLPMYNFTGADTVSLPKKLGIAARIPNIAFKIPDLEGFAQLTLTEAGTNNIKACVQATLSNGWSTHQPAVEWTTGAFAIGALLLAIWQSFSPEALGPSFLLDLFFLYQTIASTALLDLNYPSVYRSFTLNFAWAMGFLSSSSIQNSINRMRHLTGGSLADSSTGSAIGLVNRKLSPYNAQAAGLRALVTRATDPVHQFVQHLVTSITSKPPSSFGHAALSTSASQAEVQTVTPGSSNVLQAGVPIYVNSVNISTANAFMTIFLDLMMLSAVAITTFLLIYLLLIFAKRRNPKKHNSWTQLLQDYSCYVGAWGLRLGLIILFPSLIFIFYQWTLKDSWLSVLLSVFTLVAILALIGYPAISTLRFALASRPSSIYSHQRFFASHGPLYARYRLSRFYFFVPVLFAVLLKPLFIAFAKTRGDVQIAGIVVIDAFVLLFLCFFRPFRTRKEDSYSIFHATIRLVGSGLLIAFLENLGVNAIKRVIFGFIIIVLFSLAVIVMFTQIIIESIFGTASLSISKGFVPAPLGPSIVEKEGSDSSVSWDTEQGLGRPINPTPDHAVPLDRGYLLPHEFSELTTPAPSSGPCASSTESGTMTVGSLLPSRWGAPISTPGSPASSSAQRFSGLQTMSELSSSPRTPVTASSHYSDEQSAPFYQHSSHGHEAYI